MLSQVLSKPITWKASTPELIDFLDKLQGNILKGHGRTNVVYLFCRFRDDATEQARMFLRAQVDRVRSAHVQLQAAERHRSDRNKKDTSPFVSVFLTRSGYDYFGIPESRQPADPKFRAGMAASDLNDPPPDQWDSHLRDPHAMIMVAVLGPDQAQVESTDLLSQIGQIGDVLGRQSGELIGNQFFNDKGRGVENFGYVDGRSQPLVLTEDVTGRAGHEEGPLDKWPGKQEFPVNQFVLRDPGVDDAHAYGSYFVFRQLEQDVRGFKMREDEINLKHDANLPSDDFKNRDSASVGRLESGTPYAITNDDNDHPNVTNNFNFNEHPMRCPHFAHIRKVNPRTAATNQHIMIRRGITYGTRTDIVSPTVDPSRIVLDDTTASKHRPSGGVGLLFQSYQADIANQFEVTQNWANDPGNGGLDPVIGQRADAILDWPLLFDSASTEKVNFYRRSPEPGTTLDPAKKMGPGMGAYVRLLGGGYFFAPSIPFLLTL